MSIFTKRGFIFTQKGVVELPITGMASIVHAAYSSRPALADDYRVAYWWFHAFEAPPCGDHQKDKKLFEAFSHGNLPRPDADFQR